MRSVNRIQWIIFALTLSVGFVEAQAEIVVVVSSKSEVENLTPGQVTDIFLGKISRFPGGQRAVPLDQPEGSPVREEFYRIFAQRTAAQIKAHWSTIIFTGRGFPPAVVEDDQALRDRVAQNPDAIAYIDRRLVDERVRIVSP
jgi:ABC-type phosphate transport system substrate-binding protein